MSTRLERLSKLEKQGKVHPTKAREIVIQARNDEIFALKARLRTAEDLLRRIAAANVIFPSMCANNMEAWNLAEELKQYLPQRGEEPK